MIIAKMCYDYGMKPLHIPVLLDEVLEVFKSASLQNPSSHQGGKIPAYIDCTLGYGGHSSAILECFKDAKLIACDQDENAYNYAKERFKAQIANARMSLYHCNFSKLISCIDTNALELRGILADIGVSSPQLDINERGFGLNSDSLDMRMDAQNPLNASIIVNEYAKDELERVLGDYGELPNASSLAHKIIQARAKAAISSAKQLCQIIGNAKLKGRDVSLSRLVLQALRIEVNDELGVLNKLLDEIERLKPSKCVLCIISFHSLEDRIIKERFKLWAKECICDERALRCECGKNHALGRIISKKPITPSAAAIKENPRASCAKMRVFEFK